MGLRQHAANAVWISGVGEPAACLSRGAGEVYYNRLVFFCCFLEREEGWLVGGKIGEGDGRGVLFVLESLAHVYPGMRGRVLLQHISVLFFLVWFGFVGLSRVGLGWVRSARGGGRGEGIIMGTCHVRWVLIFMRTPFPFF